MEREQKEIIEVKMANHSISPGLVYFHQKYKYPATQVVCHLKKERKVGDIQIVSASNFLSRL